MGEEMTKDAGGPAFPGEVYSGTANGVKQFEPHSGMTLLDWFAGQALLGLLSNPRTKHVIADEVSKNCYGMAKAMLAEKRKREGV